MERRIGGEMEQQWRQEKQKADAEKEMRGAVLWLALRG